MKREISVALGARSYPVVVADSVEEAWVAPLGAWVEARHVAVVSDTNVAAIYREPFAAALTAAGARKCTWCVVPAGEASKSAEQLNALYDALLGDRFGRDGVVCALGGGVVGDLGGFAAATVHRGVALVQVPTTLLAMVDSAIGGKTGINHSAGKNLIGAFKQPKAVLAHLGTLDTLPARERSCGFAEIIKYGVIADGDLFADLGARAAEYRAGAGRQLLDIVLTSARIKADVVARDEEESGLRMVLNFGHTLGHAIERTAGYGRWSHGEAVAAGMVLAAELGSEMGVTPPSLANSIAEVCRAYGLPDGLPKEDRGVLADAIGSDKKVRGDDVFFVFAREVGTVEVDRVPLTRLTTWLRD